MTQTFSHRLALPLAAALLLTACIDEDLSQCGEQHEINYRLHASIAQFQAELNNQLDAEDEQTINRMLTDALTPVFADLMHDVNLYFYNADGLAYTDSRVINAAEASFELYLPVDSYMHHAVANPGAESNLTHGAIDDRYSHHLSRLEGEFVSSHEHGIYIGHLEIAEELAKQEDVELTVDLYMANCASALVLDLNGNEFDEITAYASGFTDTFAIDDLSYHFLSDYRVNTNVLSDGEGRMAFYAVHLPSGSWTRANGDWQYELYVRKGDTTTKNVVTSSSPIDAGELQLLKVKLDAQGTATSVTPNVAVSVTLDWKQGNEWDIPM